METPICTICAKTGVLCSACETRLSKGDITVIDVELSKILHETGLEEAGFLRAIESGDYVIILTKKENIGKLIGRNGENIRRISKKLGRNVRAIGAESLKDMICDLIAPARVSSINTAYMPDGSTTKRVKIGRHNKKKLRMNPKDIERLVSSLTPERIEITFEE
ncbi:MAG: KH domain-containing protein [Candidatus Altiarchaeota archaeon]|nr:KH domain-containing protein [Candidatus Altiarchaeota archaeon]